MHATTLHPSFQNRSYLYFVRRKIMKKTIKLFANIKSEENWLAMQKGIGPNKKTDHR